jgi:hypothetical protein
MIVCMVIWCDKVESTDSIDSTTLPPDPRQRLEDAVISAEDKSDVSFSWGRDGYDYLNHNYLCGYSATFPCTITAVVNAYLDT